MRVACVRNSVLGLKSLQRSVHTAQHAWSPRCVLHTRQTTNTRLGRQSVVSAASTAFTPQLVFNTVTLAVMPVYGLMIAFPKTQLTKSVVSSPLFYTVGSLLYLAALAVWGCEGLLGSVWGAFRQCLADQQVTAFAALFQCSKVTALTWTHLLLLDLCVARHVYLDGLRNQVVTAHSIVLCFMFGPTGLLSHMVTSRAAQGHQQSDLSSA